MLPQLRSVGYDGIFQPRHISMASNFNGGRPDGVAIFWNTQRIEKVIQLPIGWKDKNGNCTGSLHNASLDGMKNGKRAKQVAIAVQLKVKATNRHFVVMTAHLKSGTEPDDIPGKKAQAKEVAGIIKNIKHNDRNMPVIFGCDFNNKPEDDEDNSHRIFYEELKMKKGGYKVTSAYGKVRSEGKYGASPTYQEVMGWEPPFTVDKVRKGGAQKDKVGGVQQTIDFIFYTKEIECSRILDITKDDLEDCRIVGWRYPSDHFCIAADLTFKKHRRRRLVQAIIDAHDN